MHLPLDKEAVLGILPHRDPFLFIDEVTALEMGKLCEARWRLDENLPFFRGHFPGKPVTPGVLLLEAMAQAGAIAVLSLPEYAGKIALFGSAEHVKFRKSAYPGDTVTLRMTMDKLGRRAGKGRGVAMIGDEIAAQAEITFVIAQEDNP